MQIKQNSKINLSLILGMLVAAVLTFGGIVSSQNMRSMDKTDTKDVEKIIAGWKAKPQELARTLIAKYGMPNEATTERLIWHNNGPWKHTELVNEEIPHNFPMPHPDMLKQTINYSVPSDKFDELAKYDGSVIVERTKGEISARCDKEGANFLALNLADEIVRGRRSVDDARKFYAETIGEMKNQNYMQGFLFQVFPTAQGDTDKAIMMKTKEMKKNN